MEKINEILARQQPHFKNIEPGCSVSDALCRMSTYNTEYLIVMDETDNFLGLITEHDVASKALFMNRSLTDTRVMDILNTQLPFADAGDTLEQCMTVMKKHHVKFLPVFSNLQFRGIVSTDDILDEAVNHRSEIFD
ncbi:MAG: CBS domain-containing protein [Sphingobacteriales bacterium]|nr:CBS domain-containing protein [Sphingobacteriales bacterium]